MATTQTIRVGFIGAGANTRRHHIPKLKAQPGVELVAVANRSKESGERVAKEFGIGRVDADWRAIVQANDIDAVCIGTWPYTHAEMTVAALGAGKHALCEARMAMNAAEGRRMLEASRRAPNLVAQLVPAPHTLEVDGTIQQLLAEGYVGDVLAVELRRPGSLRRSGGAAALAPGHRAERAQHPEHGHLVRGDVALVRAGEAPHGDDGNRGAAAPGRERRLAGRAGAGSRGHPRRPRERRRAHLRFSGVTALAPSPEVWIFGSDGTLRLDADARRLYGGRRGASALAEIAIPEERRIGWRVEEEFVNAIRGNEKIRRTTFEDGVRYMEFTDAVTRSAASGQAVDVAGL